LPAEAPASCHQREEGTEFPEKRDAKAPHAKRSCEETGTGYSLHPQPAPAALNLQHLA
jgi:hypothetical protein